jgi:hypothetical protein
MDAPQDLWCRLEREGESVSRVVLMHPDGRILFSYPAVHFDADIVRQMQTGRIRAWMASPETDGSRLLWLEDESARVLYSERTPGQS